MQKILSNLKDVPFKRIKVDPFLFPEHLRIGKTLSFDNGSVSKYFALIQDHGYQEPLKIGVIGEDYFLLDNYSFYVAMERHYRNNPEVPVSCLAISGFAINDLKKFSIRLQSVHGSDSGLHRLVKLRMLFETGCKLPELKRLYGIQGCRSEAKKMERDYKIVRHPQLLKRVLGLSGDTLNFSVLNELAKPRLDKATLSYALAVDISDRLPDDAECVAKFDHRFEEYCTHLKEQRKFEDEEVKPIFAWKGFNRKAVRQQADDVIGHFGYQYSDPELQDVRWDVDLNPERASVSLPALSINLTSRSTENIKRIVDATYFMDTLRTSLKRLLQNIGPNAHGLDINWRPNSIDRAADSQFHLPRHRDPGYFHFIREMKLLRYCNRERLLKSISLEPHHFGFKSSRPDARSDWTLAKNCFEKWISGRTATFRSEIDRGQTGVESVYLAIMHYLAESTNSVHTGITFDQFTTSVFKSVFEGIDSDKDVELAKARLIQRERNHLRFPQMKKLTEHLMHKIEERAVEGTSSETVDVLISELLQSENAETVINELLLPQQEKILEAAGDLRSVFRELSSRIPNEVI